MHVRIKVFASLKALAGGADQVSVEVTDDATVGDALAQLSWVDEQTALVVAVNRVYADRSTRLSPDDEVALIPPVSGGDPAGDRQITVEITGGPIDEHALAQRVRDPRAGAVVVFAGVTREVAALEYEAYAAMAQEEIERIAAAAADRHGLCKVAVAHRYGTVRLSEASVVIAVSAAHRAQAFDGAREVIDQIKLSAPIWKRERGRWAAGQLPGQGASPSQNA